MASLLELIADLTRPAPLVVTALELGQANDCARIHATAFSHPWSASDFATLLKDPATQADKITVSGGRAVIGFAVTKLALDEAEVLTLAIDAPLRRRGAGYVLLVSHLIRLREKGAGSVCLEVDSDNRAAAALYGRCGFRQVGAREAYYPKADGGKAKALILKRDLT